MILPPSAWAIVMKHRHIVEKLSKMLVYILGRQPDEFALIPDAQGYVKIKDLMKALGEEPGWRHVRSGHIREVIYTSGSPAVEIEDNRIRAVDRSRLLRPEVAAVFPKVLYHPVRQRAYPIVMEKGLQSDASGRRIMLTGEMALAQRIGRRIDPAPVILTIHWESARKNGATLWRFGKQLFLSDRLPAGSLSGPPLPKNRPEPKKAETPKPTGLPKTPGGFTLDLTVDPLTRNRPPKGSRQRKNEWKRDRKRRNRSRTSP